MRKNLLLGLLAYLKFGYKFDKVFEQFLFLNNYIQQRILSKERVSAASASESLNLATNAASYLLFRHASARFAHTEREERRIW